VCQIEELPVLAIGRGRGECGAGSRESKNAGSSLFLVTRTFMPKNLNFALKMAFLKIFQTLLYNVKLLLDHKKRSFKNLLVQYR
jgi:hypothetical protein